MAFFAIGLTYSATQAQSREKDYCGVSHGQVCKGSHKIGYHCYKTRYAQNFKVCKNDNGYFICCETPNRRNSTHPLGYARINTLEQNTVSTEPIIVNPGVAYAPGDTIVERSGSYTGYYTGKGHIKVCYGGDNVAELNRAPYQGCPSPAFDGPAENNYRNMNVATPDVNAPQAPIQGRRE